MRTTKNIKLDLRYLKEKFGVGVLTAFISNRGFHALLFYRLANACYRHRIPLIPLILSRIIQIFYAIDIDFKCVIEGGIVIIHGVGLVIGEGAVVKTNVILYHGVTLGRKRQLSYMTDDDGYPYINVGCVLAAGCKLIGRIDIGENSIIGPNVVLLKSVEAYSTVKVPDPQIIVKKKNL